MVPRTGDGEMLYRKKQKSCDKKKKSENSKLLYQLKKEKTKSMQQHISKAGVSRISKGFNESPKKDFIFPYQNQNCKEGQEACFENIVFILTLISCQARTIL